MADEASKEPAGTVRCRCGTAVPIAVDAVGREVKCPSCSAPFKAVWAVDPKTRAKILMRVAAKGAGIRIPEGSLQLSCSCGQVLVAKKDQAGKRVKCPVCGVAMTIEKYKDPTTLETRVRRQEAGTSAGPIETAYIAAKSLGRTTRRRKAPAGAEDVLCPCGEYLRVFAEHLDKKVMCPSCGTLMQMEKNTDPKAVTTVRPRIVGKTEPPPKVDPDEWSMSDFS
jgi:DNA-directed RNA polymerase subunit M/transcription elongation factor TFIIS